VNRVVVCLLIIILSACDEDTESKKLAQNIFPSVIEYQQCLENMDPSDDQYHKVVIEFDSGGYSGIGWAVYDDANCETLANRSHDVNSHYPMRLGYQVINKDGTTGHELIFADPENAGKSGTVYHIENDVLCFAVGTVKLNIGFTNRPNLSSINFTSASINGDFSNLEIDRDNCFKINMGE
jgi:hypothetical protein